MQRFFVFFKVGGGEGDISELLCNSNLCSPNLTDSFTRKKKKRTSLKVCIFPFICLPQFKKQYSIRVTVNVHVYSILHGNNFQFCNHQTSFSAGGGQEVEMELCTMVMFKFNRIQTGHTCCRWWPTLKFTHVPMQTFCKAVKPVVDWILQAYWRKRMNSGFDFDAEKLKK